MATATRYLIKATYTEGSHAGKSYFIGKGGYVVDADGIQWDDWTYKTYGTANRVCKKLYEDNELSRKCERQDEAWRIKKGFPPREWYIYEAQTYEPYPVEAIIKI